MIAHYFLKIIKKTHMMIFKQINLVYFCNLINKNRLHKNL
jgi:hypothetical protein